MYNKESLNNLPFEIVDNELITEPLFVDNNLVDAINEHHLIKLWCFGVPIFNLVTSLPFGQTMNSNLMNAVDYYCKIIEYLIRIII